VPDRVHTSPIADPGSLTDLLDGDDSVSCWIRHGDGMIGIGAAHRATFRTAAQAEAWWTDLVASTPATRDAGVADEPMTGPVAFVSFPFAPDGPHEIVVPRRIVGRREGVCWMTTWDGDETDDTPARTPAGTDTPTGADLCFHHASLGHDGWTAAVSDAVAAIHAGGVDKVVLARDEVAVADDPIDLPRVLARLASMYPQTWTFAVRNLVGASPELLVRQDRGLITSRVLAGTIHGDLDDSVLADALSSSSKDLAEHEFAVASVADALRPHVTSLHVPEVPFVLQLPNVMHLASDITGAVRGGSTVLELADAIHPSAAVCGTPTNAARDLIATLEHLDRGRYAGPVGWINAAGDGEIALALRCGMIEGATARIFAGCGIVADSDPEAEWDETVAKLLPMKQALGAR